MAGTPTKQRNVTLQVLIKDHVVAMSIESQWENYETVKPVESHIETWNYLPAGIN